MVRATSQPVRPEEEVGHPYSVHHIEYIVHRGQLPGWGLWAHLPQFEPEEKAEAEY